MTDRTPTPLPPVFAPVPRHLLEPRHVRALLAWLTEAHLRPSLLDLETARAHYGLRPAPDRR